MSIKRNTYLRLGTFLINIMFFSCVITASLFLVRISITVVNLILALICSVLADYILFDKQWKKSLFVALVSMIIFIGIIFVVMHSFDYSWDGNTYHKTMTGFMKNGWNPLSMTFYDYADAHYQTCSILTQTWLDAYPKGSEMFAACIYAVTGNIETGKCFNLLACIALFFVSYGLLDEMIGLKKWQTMLCSLLCVLHPVAFSQFFTYYIDGFLWQIFLLCIFCLVYLTLFKGKKLTTYCYYMLFVSIVIGLNLKFSSLLYFGLPCIVFFIYWCISVKSKRPTMHKKFVLKCFVVLVISVIVGTCYVGSTSYIINIIRHRNPVYTMIGEGSTDLVTVQLPLVYQDMSNVMRFLGSLFSKTNGSKAIEQIEWKIPFTVHSGEFVAAQSCDVRTAGWGIFFSGVFLISMVVILLALARHGKTHKLMRNVIYLLLGTMFLSILVVPGLNWARYFGALFYVPVMAMVYLFSLYNKSKNKLYSMLSFCLFVLLIADMVPNATLAYKTVMIDYKMICQELEDFRDIAKDNEVTIGYSSRGRFSGRFFTLDDYGIENYQFEEQIDETLDGNNMLFPYYGLAYKINP